MPAHLVKRIDLDRLYPPFLDRVLAVLAACEKQGSVYVALHGWRSRTEQAALYFQGRTRSGPIVTDARPGWSAHNYGIAVDVALDGNSAPGLQPDWAAAKYVPLADEGALADLQVNVPSGRDYGHIQLPLRQKLNRSEHEILSLLKDCGTNKAAWALLDTLGPW